MVDDTLVANELRPSEHGILATGIFGDGKCDDSGRSNAILQFGEVQWWYFPGPTATAVTEPGLPFYDAYTTETFQATYGQPMAVIASQYADPGLLAQECAFLPGLIGTFTKVIRDFVRSSVPGTQFEVLYPPDVNNTALNQIINFPLNDWIPTNLACLKTENLAYTAERNLNLASQSIQLPSQFGFPPSQSSHLVGISDYTTPWKREAQIASVQPRCRPPCR